MDDIVKRLRDWQQSDCLGAQCVDERCEAADEIERLRAYLDESRRTFGSTTFAKDLSSKLDAALADAASLRELLNVYNVGGWTDSQQIMTERDEWRRIAGNRLLKVKEAEKEIERWREHARERAITIEQLDEAVELWRARAR